MPEDPSVRLQKVLARAGVASRRKSEEIIRQGRVTVNGRVVTQLGTKVNPAVEEIRVDGQSLEIEPAKVYIILNKPRGVLSTMEDPRGRRALGELVSLPARMYPVGRLDVISEGLILLTDDGELANVLTHPRYQHEKEYLVLVNGRPSSRTLNAWRRGVMLEGKMTAPAGVDVARNVKDDTLLRVVMREGRKRQIRRVAALLGHPVRELKRVRLGPLRLGSLASGQWRRLSEKEVRGLTGLKRPRRKRKGRKSKRRYGGR
jgi:23S rRNA pseudouridine2605 synthase